MGSWQSGRYPTSTRPWAEDLLRLDVSELHRARLLVADTCYYWDLGGGVLTELGCDGPRLHVGGVVVDLEWVDLAVGGPRPYALCPYCERRVRVLFVGGDGIGCRHCLRVRHRSQYRTDYERAAARARGVWRELAWWPCTLRDEPPPRPRGRHRRRWARIAAEYDGYRKEFWKAIDDEVAGLRRIHAELSK